MTYKEALQKSLETFKTEEIEFDDPTTGEHIKQEAKECLPICFSDFLMNMATILTFVTSMMLSQRYPDVCIGRERVSGKEKENPTPADLAMLLGGADIVRSTVLHLQVQGFIEYLIKQSADTDEIDKMWYSREVLGEKWNEYANAKNG